MKIEAVWLLKRYMLPSETYLCCRLNLNFFSVDVEICDNVTEIGHVYRFFSLHIVEFQFLVLKTLLNVQVSVSILYLWLSVLYSHRYRRDTDPRPLPPRVMASSAMEPAPVRVFRKYAETQMKWNALMNHDGLHTYGYACLWYHAANTWTVADAGDIRTWQIMIILRTWKPENHSWSPMLLKKWRWCVVSLVYICVHRVLKCQWSLLMIYPTDLKTWMAGSAEKLRQSGRHIGPVKKPS